MLQPIPASNPAAQPSQVKLVVMLSSAAEQHIGSQEITLTIFNIIYNLHRN
jgi:hypothetical protein